MKRWIALPLLAAVLGAAPAPLVVGAVRDQFGDPIAGAVVSLPTAGAATTTDAAGTFALAVATPDTLLISCAYCRTTRVAVAAGEPVVAIVERYAALISNAPNDRDLASLPYAHAESALALHPFAVLEDSRSTLPGPRLLLDGLSSQGGALVDNGFPSYDISAGVSTFSTIPSFAAAHAGVRSFSDGFRYGDLAAGGIFSVQTEPEGGRLGATISGSEAALALAQKNSGVSFAYGESSDGIDKRDRIDGTARTLLGDDALSGSFVAAQDRFAPGFAGSTDQYFGGVRLRYDRVRENNLYAEVLADRAAYVAHPFSPVNPIAGLWSDAQIQAGVASNTPVRFFSDVSFRTSTGYYSASANGLNIAGKILQSRLDAGAESSGDRYSWTAGIGAFSVDYSGGPNGFSLPLHAQILIPSLSASYDLSPQWTFSFSTGSSFRLPSLLEAYTYPNISNDLSYDRYWSTAETIAYGDRRRLRAALTAMQSTANNLDVGTIRAAGASAAWQAVPKLALRAWVMHFYDASSPEEIFLRFGAAPRPATVGSAWITYDNSTGLRADAIYRSDLINYLPDRHIDGSLSWPVNASFLPLRWFLSTESRHGTRYIGAGLRLDSP